MADAGDLPARSLAGVIGFLRPDIAVRPVATSDQPFCRALFHEHRGPEFAQLNLDGRMLAMLLDQQFDAQQSAFRQAFPEANHFIIEHDGLAVGQVMTAFRDERTLHVIDIGLSIAARGRGIGTEVISGLGKAARAQGAARMTLSVLRSNDDARRLYGRLGFCVDGNHDANTHIAMVRPLT